MWRGGLFGMPATTATTFAQTDAGVWEVVVDAPWTTEGLYVGAFASLESAVAFVYGPPLVQLALPLEAP